MYKCIYMYKSITIWIFCITSILYSYFCTDYNRMSITGISKDLY